MYFKSLQTRKYPLNPFLFLIIYLSKSSRCLAGSLPHLDLADSSLLVHSNVFSCTWDFPHSRSWVLSSAWVKQVRNQNSILLSPNPQERALPPRYRVTLPGHLTPFMFLYSLPSLSHCLKHRACFLHLETHYMALRAQFKSHMSLTSLWSLPTSPQQNMSPGPGRVLSPSITALANTMS